MGNRIYYDPKKIDYTLNEYELNNLSNISTNLNKDFFIATFSIFVPCAINAIVDINQNNFIASLSFIINLCVALCCLFLCIYFAIRWRQTYVSANQIIEQIKSKPQYVVNVATTSGSSIALVSSSTDNDIS